MMKFLNDLPDYPIITDLAQVCETLRDEFSRAVIVDNTDYDFDENLILDSTDPIDTSVYLSDPNSPHGRKIPGRQTYITQADFSKFSLTADKGAILTQNSIQTELTDARLTTTQPQHVEELFHVFNMAIDSFASVLQERNNTDNFYIRSWQVFAPKGAIGRAPTLHVDVSDLTALWYGGRATANVYTGHIPDNIWRAIDNGPKKSGQTLDDFTETIAPDDLLSLPTDSLILTLNKKDKDMKDPAVRQKLCPHLSGDVQEHGQIGLIMVPTFL